MCYNRYVGSADERFGGNGVRVSGRDFADSESTYGFAIFRRGSCATITIYSIDSKEYRYE
jgi:hypothetical protein